MRDVSTPSISLGAGLLLDMTRRYAEMRDVGRVRERGLFPPLHIPNELELQARWFAGDFGKHFVTTSGDKVDIVQFGTLESRSRTGFSRCCDSRKRS
jgi:hypothetical protein